MDICRHGGHPQSKEAHQSIDPTKIRGEVLNAIIQAGQRGAISDEIESLTGYPHQTVSARFSELKRLGLIFETDRKRPTKSGRMATVCMATGIEMRLFP